MTPEGHPEKFNIGTPPVITSWHTQDAFEAAMKYQSPIEIIHGKLETKIENDIMTAVQSYGITVDKEELIKALQYDRKQYEQGWEDARKAFQKPHGEWTIIRSPLSNETVVKCPFCKDEFIGNDVEDYNFCPICGAKMDADKIKSEDFIKAFGEGVKPAENIKPNEERPQGYWRDSLKEVFREHASIRGDTFHLFEIERIIDGEPVKELPEEDDDE